MKAAVVLTLMISTASFGAAQAPTHTLKGTLIDQMCQMKMKIDQAAMVKHTRECALMPKCVESGYALVTADGMIYKLDARGNEQAVAALKASKQATDLKVTLTGTTRDGMVSVTSLALDQR